jgi:subtilisin family serine protease
MRYASADTASATTRRPGIAARLAAGLAAGGVAALAAGLLGAGAASAAPAEGEILGANAAGAIKDRYIVVFKDSAAESRRAGAARDLAARFGGSVRDEYGTAVRGFTANLSEAAARRLAANPAVASVEQDRLVRVADTQSGATWGLDRVDQRALPLSGSYTYPNAAANVTAYILDTGIRMSHGEFGGRARSGYDFIDKDADASDCQGHGTHVAGTVGGATYGVAKQVNLVSVRVLDCQGSGSYSAIIAGVDWVTRNAVKPAVANMSLGGSTSASLDTAVRNSIASGVVYALAAGNDNKDACAVSPARTAEAITVGATDSADARASFSNYGTCVDIFAPGVNILSSTKGGDTSTGKMSGTSMATPHVAGVAALYLGANPAATPAQVRDAMVADSTAGTVRSLGSGSPNKLLYTGAIGSPVVTPPPSTPPSTPPAPCTVSNGYDRSIADKATVESKLTVADCAGNGSATAKVEVHVKHSDRGDLALWLIAPDGTSYKVKSATSGDNVRNLDATYTVDLSGEARNGTWKLKVTDVYSGDTGYLDSWTLTL